MIKRNEGDLVVVSSLIPREIFDEMKEMNINASALIRSLVTSYINSELDKEIDLIFKEMADNPEKYML